jgi:ElaB/YqjD/DUF883 family membrane-anchored ribosome-binding protein
MEEQREGQGTMGGGVGSTGSTGTPSGYAVGSRTGFGSTGEDAGTRAGSYDRKFINEEQGMKERVGEKLSEGKERMGEAAQSGKNRFADKLQRVGDRIEERARHMEQSGGVQARASHMALRASETLDRGADYIRSHEVAEMRDDLENAIRLRPLLSIGIAIGAGFLLARLFRD